MKHVTLCILSIIGLTISSIGQVITSDWAPSAYLGTSINYDTTISGVGPGSAGSGQSWDFSTLANDSNRIVDYVNPSELLGSIEFPNATVGILEVADEGSFSAFFESSGAAYRVLGSYTEIESTPVSFKYTDPMDIMRFPVGFGQAFSDSFEIDVETELFSFSEIGENVVEVDGSGILLTPVGLFSNVLRIKSVQTSQFVGLPPTPGGPTISENTTYLFVSAEYPGIPLLEYSLSGTNVNPNADTTIAFADPSYVSIAEKANNTFSIYPNPANTQVTISASSLVERVEVLDLFGRVVRTEAIQKSTNKTIINTSNIKSGVYLIRGISSKGETFVQRVSITH